MSYKRKRITVKIGSNVLARPDGTLDITRMSALTDQIAKLHVLQRSFFGGANHSSQLPANTFQMIEDGVFRFTHCVPP